MKLTLLMTFLVSVISHVVTDAPEEVFVPPDDPNVKFAVGAINDYYAKKGDTKTRTLVKIVEATHQFVSGSMYVLELQLTTGSNVETCTVHVWSRPWLSKDEAILLTGKPECKPEKATSNPTTKRPLGGEMEIDPKKDDVQNALKFAVSKMNAQENYMFLRKAVKITKVTSQVVQGFLYHFYGVHIATTTCKKNSGPHDLTECPVSADNADKRVCDFDVWWRLWMTPEYKLTKYECQ